jgi:hypothetical protein
MLEAHLTPCANLLYGWMLRRRTAGTPLKIDLQDFQALTSEYREQPYSDREIFEALQQLKQLQLIAVARTEVTLGVKPPDSSSLNTPQPARSFIEERARPNRFLLLLQILSGSFALGLTSVILGLALVQTQPMTLITPHPWSVLGEKNIG